MTNSEAAIHEIVAAAAEPYRATVVAQSLKDGIPATGVSLPLDPSPDDIDGEADGSIDIPFDFTTRHHGPDLEQLGLWWNSVSGWRVHTHPNPLPGDGRRWMATGVLPPPARGAAFLANMMVAYTMTGSSERPFCRRATTYPSCWNVCVSTDRPPHQDGHDFQAQPEEALCPGRQRAKIVRQDPVPPEWDNLRKMQGVTPERAIPSAALQLARLTDHRLTGSIARNLWTYAPS
ncbi:hypothetical protein H9Y04_44035 [Streptomyces sp. TRM66268-LWL]|uniref:Uncharacterized protein n=1 Tax=Streptomyces polyasparticus TaxID=2767826 RepID=A0ABR7SVH3_9ACTN|nr:hypothetical protein [Streptomyces polyasparticus]MBC9719495.1 hypothetical protein [Streptomyces polyasparticus]